VIFSKKNIGYISSQPCGLGVLGMEVLRRFQQHSPSEGLPPESGDNCACGLYGTVEKYKTNKFYLTVARSEEKLTYDDAPMSPSSGYAPVSAGHSM